MTRSTEIALLLTATDRASAIVNSLVGNTKQKLSGLSSFGKRVTDFAPKMMLVGEYVTGFFKSASEDARMADMAYKGLEVTMANLGDKRDKAGRGIVAQQLAEEADRFEKQTGIEAETVMQVQQNLALFKSLISKQSRDNGLFNSVVETAFDMQARGLGDAASNAKNLGKALEMPKENIGKLEKAGILFTAQEKKKVEMLVNTGKKAEAQRLIMEKVTDKVQGSAAAMADPMKLAQIAFDDVKESIGTALLKPLTDLSKSFVAFMKPVGEFISSNPELIKSVAGIAVTLLGVGKAITIVGSLMQASPVGLIIMGIATAAVLVVQYWDPIKNWFTGLWNSVTGTFKKAWDWIKGMFLNYTPTGLVIKHWDGIKLFFTNTWNAVKNGTRAAWDWIKNLFLNYTPQGLIIKHWDVVTNFFSDLWGRVRGTFSEWIGWVFSIGPRMLEAGGNIVTSIWEGIKSKATVLLNGVKEIAQKVRDFFPFSPAKTGPLKDIHKIKLVETIAQSVNANPLIQSMQGVAQRAFDFQPKAVPAFAPIQRSQPVQARSNTQNFGGMTFAPTIHLNGSASESDKQSMLTTLKSEFAKMMKQYEAQQNRIALR